MSFFRQYYFIIGSLVLILIIIVLVSVPSTILAPQATFISTELRYATARETLVRTKMDFGDIEHMRAFPMKFGNWIGLDFDPKEMMEVMGADLLVLRTYLNTDYYQPVHFIIMQSQDPSSFHPPPICYRALNWEIEEEITEEITVSDGTWTNAGEPVSINAKGMVVSRELDEGERQREVVLYYYVKGRLFENMVTMIEATALAPIEGPYGDVLSELNGFLGETVPYMFEYVALEREILAFYLARSWGGRAIMAVLILLPLAFIIYPRVRHR